MPSGTLCVLGLGLVRTTRSVENGIPTEDRGNEGESPAWRGGDQRGVAFSYIPPKPPDPPGGHLLPGGEGDGERFVPAARASMGRLAGGPAHAQTRREARSHEDSIATSICIRRKKP